MTLIAALLGLSTLVYRHSIASMAAMIFIIVAYCMIDLLPKKLTSIRTIWVGFIVTSLVLALEVTFALSTDSISSVGKTISFLKRTSMWTIALNKLPENFLFGIGLMNTTYMKTTFGYAQLHNSLFTALVWGGTVGLFIYSHFIFSMQRGLNRTGNRTVSRFMGVLFAGTMIASLVDGLELTTHAYMLYFIIARCDQVTRTLASVSIKLHRQKRICLLQLAPVTANTIEVER